MIDREGRVTFGSLLVFVLALGGSAVVEGQLGIAIRDRPLVSFLLFAGVAVALPQLYLAVAADEDRPRSRIRFAAVGTAVLAVAFAADADGIQYLVIAGTGTAALFGLLSYEALSGYRAASEGGDGTVVRLQ